jgi:glycosyltransferase involved in cell wall biosynthesis
MFREGVTVVGISVIIPALNEVESIGQVVASMPWGAIAECIVVDNGSTDGTGAVAAAAGARVVTSVRGYGAAMSAGVEAAYASSEILVFMDGDGADRVEFMEQLVMPVALGEADFVLGSRILGKREAGSMLGSQVFAGWLIGWLVKILYGYRYSDMCAFRVIRRDVLERMQMTEMTFGWNLEMQIKAVQMGLRVREIPVDYGCRIGGVSKVSGDLKASMQAAYRIFGVFWRVRKKRVVRG